MLTGLRNIARMLTRVVTAANEADELNPQRERDALMAERAAMTGGRGFRQFPKAIRKYADGATRGDRKRAARATANAKVSEDRAPEFRHQRSLHAA
jgi:hypothetical protein